MRRIVSSMLVLALLLSLFAASAFASEVEPNEVVQSEIGTEGGTQPDSVNEAIPTEEVPDDLSSQTTQPNETAQPEETTNTVSADNTTRTVTDGMHVVVYYESDQGSYIPEFNLELWNVAEEKLISSAVGNSQNFSNGKYSLIFNHPGYKLGDQFALILRSADDIVDEVNFNGYSVKVNTHFKFGIEPFVYYEGVNDEKVFQDLTATKLNPIEASLKTNPKKIGLQLQSESGTPLKQLPVNIKLLEGKGTLTAKSDNNGMVWLDSIKLTWKFLVSSEGKIVKDDSNGKAEIELPSTVIANTQKSVLTFPIVFENEATSGSLKVDFSTEANTDLSKAWSTFDIALSDPNGVSSTFSANLDTKEIEGIVDGKYKASVTAKYAEVKLNSDALVTLSDGKGGIGGIVKPKHLLEISKDGKPFNFSVINVEKVADKQYKGTNPISFAVTPGESFMIKDNDTGKVETVAIDANSPVTRVVLGAGVVFGGSASTPHTGDDIVYLVIGFILSLSVAAGCFVLYNRKRKNSSPKISVLSIMLAVALVAPLFAPSGVHAASSDANVGGTPPASGGANSSTAAGTFQTSERIAVLQFGFIPNKVKSDGKGVLNPDSKKADLEDSFKFNYEDLLFYMAPSKTSDNLFRKAGSGLITFERGTGVSTLYGNNPLYPDSRKGQSHAELMKRTLDYADKAVAKSSNINYFEQIIADTLYNIAPSDSNRSLSGEGNSKVIGDSLKGMIEAYILRHGSQDAGEQFDAQVIGSLMFSGYLDMIKSKGILKGEEYTGFEQMMRDKFKKNELIFFAQTVVGISVKDSRSAYDRDYAFISMHDATDWYLWTRQKARPTDSVLQGLTANREFEAVSKGGATSAEQGSQSPYKENGNLPNTFRTYARDFYARTLKPVSSAIPMSSDASVNGFGGWGYQPWGYGSNSFGNAPAIDAQLNVTVVDKSNNPVGQPFIVPVNGWSEENKKLLGLLTNDSDLIIQGGMTITHQGKSYDIIPDQNAKISLVDKNDNENINKANLIKGEIGIEKTVPVPSSDGSETWEIELGYDTPLPLDLHKYLGGDGNSGVSSVENKYEGKKEFSNAQLTLYVKAKEDSIEPITSNYDVPQWRLSKYWDNISDKGINKARFNLSLPISTFTNPKLSPSGNTLFSLVDPDLSNTPWALSRAKLFNDTPTKNISVYNPAASFNLAGDLLAVRDNSSVANIKLASWLNNFSLFDGRIASASTGAAENKPVVTKSHDFKYGVKSPYSSYTYSETRYNWVSTQYGGYYVPYTWSGSATPSYLTADYETSIRFNRYIPKDSSAPKAIADASDSTNGMFWQAKQGKETLKVNPEVLYAYDDASGNTSVAFAAGDKLREIRPVSYNLAQFVNVEVTPEVVGASTATDANAKALAKNLNAGGKQVIYKGSAITTNFEVKGELELKTFALDIGSSALKNAWNLSSAYSTDAINETYLSEYATQDEATGKWQVTFDANGKLVIDNKEHGGQSAKLTATESSKAIKEHTLEVRGGKLVGVDGNRNLDSLSQELKDALTRMHILGNDNIFSSFESGSGDKLTEQAVATLGNAVRGSNDLKVGSGWYAEDTTTLVIRVYTTTFELPSNMYVDKIPMEIPGLEVSGDKNQFFSKGFTGHTKLSYKVGHVGMVFDSSKGDFGGNRSIDFIVGNTSIMDTFSTVQ
ncbi:MAG: hypothetical protein E6230_06630 [Paenibacillus dendritiformis]|uniref:hypothetical protein n=1 Tax=uncultured Paenibacillus sp. TaxID=227322 RepID=UPI0025CED11C|nr:hypothetical protein [uncultured Paenibacillus sp.]MDU5141837.1 hypothetical protein [Paenibacillus dendritiformis]